MTYRVIQWATGAIGRHSIKILQDNPGFELVGAKVYSPEKIGKDVGELAGIGTIGVSGTQDEATVLALDADCVMYAPLLPDVDEMCRILESGKNLVTPCGFVYLSPDDPIAQRLDAACQRGNASFHGSGLHPGFYGDRLPLLMSALTRSVSKVKCIEISDLQQVSHSKDLLRTQLGFGLPKSSPDLRPKMLPVLQDIFKQSMDMVAKGLGFSLDEYRYEFEPAFATELLSTNIGPIPEGHVAGHRYRYQGFVAGHCAVEFEAYWRMGDAIAPNWPYSAPLEYHVEISGDPPLKFICISRNEEGLIATTTNTVHAIPYVCESPPGIRTSLDLPLIVAQHSYKPIR
jgi:hypothetical protein